MLPVIYSVSGLFIVCLKVVCVGLCFKNDSEVTIECCSKNLHHVTPYFVSCCFLNIYIILILIFRVFDKSL
jgi:hypothetical protein